MAERKYKKNGAVFRSAQELADVFISQENKSKLLQTTVFKLNKQVADVESENYNIEG